MEKIDLVLAIPLMWGLFIGFKKGLILELASLVGLILGIYGAIKFSDFTAEKLSEYVEVSQDWIGLLSFLLTFVIIVFTVFILAKVLDKALKIVALGFVNRIFGALFGFVKYALILSFLLYFFDGLNSRFGIVEENWKENSLLIEPLEVVVKPFQELLSSFNLHKIEELTKEVD